MFDKYTDIVTVEELAKMLRIGRRQAYELAASDRLRTLRVGRSIRITKASVIEFLTREQSDNTRKYR
jgi:excisionase family DNA binding protein